MYIKNVSKGVRLDLLESTVRFFGLRFFFMFSFDF